MDFEDMLKKAMESGSGFGNKNDDEEETVDSGHDFLKLISMLEMGSMIKLAKVAQDRMSEDIDALTDDLLKLRDTSEKVYIRSRALTKIIRTAKNLSILHSIITSATIMGSSSLGGESTEEQAKKNLDLILRLADM